MTHSAQLRTALSLACIAALSLATVSESYAATNSFYGARKQIRDNGNTWVTANRCSVALTHQSNESASYTSAKVVSYTGEIKEMALVGSISTSLAPALTAANCPVGCKENNTQVRLSLNGATLANVTCATIS